MLLARYAEAAFWMARYMERAENTARILDVQETFARDSRVGESWKSVVVLNQDEDRFATVHDTAADTNVIHFYVLDADNPTSILSAVSMARENARTLRPLISTEMWTQLNVFHNRLNQLTPDDVGPSRLSRLCGTIKEACQTHTGIIEGTFYRDHGWYFYHMGKYLERADQTTRLVDIKYHSLLPQVEDVGSPLDLSQWNALLRSAAGYHAFRRVHPRGMDPVRVAGFLLYNSSFPRSVAASVDRLADLIGDMKGRYRVRRGNEAMEQLDEIQAVLREGNAERDVARGLHEHLDRLQRDFASISTGLGQAFFGAAQS